MYHFHDLKGVYLLLTVLSFKSSIAWHEWLETLLPATIAKKVNHSPHLVRNLNCPITSISPWLMVSSYMYNTMTNNILQAKNLLTHNPRRCLLLQQQLYWFAWYSNIEWLSYQNQFSNFSQQFYACDNYLRFCLCFSFC